MSAKMEFIDGLLARLDHGGFDALRAALIQTRPEPFRIDSLYRLQRRQEHGGGEVTTKLRAREFGGRVAWHAETLSRSLRTDGFDARREVEALLDVACWLTRGRGYGNLLLGARLVDIASVAIGLDVIDLDCPLAIIDERLSRCRRAIAPPLARRDTLNLEAGAGLFGGDAADEAHAQQALDGVWAYGQLTLWEESSSPAEVMALRDAAPGLPTLSAIQDRLGLADEHVALIRAHRSFFRDDPEDEGPYPATFRSQWERKRHAALVRDLTPSTLVHVEALFELRRAVGEFPTHSTYHEDVRTCFASEIEAAFAEAWQTHAQDHNRTLFATAARAYARLLAGTFLDEDTLRS